MSGNTNFSHVQEHCHTSGKFYFFPLNQLTSCHVTYHFWKFLRFLKWMPLNRGVSICKTQSLLKHAIPSCRTSDLRLYLFICLLELWQVLIDGKGRRLMGNMNFNLKGQKSEQ